MAQRQRRSPAQVPASRLDDESAFWWIVGGFCWWVLW